MKLQRFIGNYSASAGVLALCGCLIAPANAKAAANTGDLLQFLDGGVLHGTLLSADAAHGLRWQHPAAQAAFDLTPAHVDRIRFPQANSLALAPSCHIRFAGGDDLYGSLVSLNADTMEFNTWFGGTLKIPRAAIQTITFLPKSYSIVYEGPSDASEWTVSNGRQNGQQVRIRGANGMNNIIIMQGGQLIIGGDTVTTAPGGPPNWTFRDGSFVTAGAGTLGRNFNLSGSSTIEFDLSCTGPFSLLLNLYSSAVDRVDGYVPINGGGNNAKSLLVEMDSGQIALLRAGGMWSGNEFHNVNMTNFDVNGKPARVTLNCNKDEGSLTVLVDGVVVKRWTDLGNFSDMGTGFVIMNQTQQSGTVKVSNFKVSKWGGKYEPDLAPVGTAGSDMISFINRDKAGGKIETITDGKVDVNLGGNVLHIPAERVRQIDFAQSSAVTEPRGPWEVRAVFPGGGSISFRLERWDDKSVSGHSALFGSLAFQPRSIREMEFNLDRPRTEMTPVLENEFDALDQ